MNIGTLKRLIGPVEDGLRIIVVSVLDDGRKYPEPCYAVYDVTRELDEDIPEDYARFACARLVALMTIGILKKLLEPLEDWLHIIMVGPVLNDDGDETEARFELRDVAVKLDADIAEEYARFSCDRIDEDGYDNWRSAQIHRQTR